MEWPGKPNFTATDTAPIYISAYPAPAAFVQKSGQFSVYTILRSGHMVRKWEITRLYSYEI